MKKLKISGLIALALILFHSLIFAQDSSRPPFAVVASDTGWHSLFNGTGVSAWKSAQGEGFPDSGWVIQNDMLVVLGGKKAGDIVTRAQYSSFELRLEFKLTPGANSGIKYFVQPGTSLGLEYQILDDKGHPDAELGVAGNRTLASLYDLIPAENKQANPIGEWNRARILVQGSHVEHWLNDNKVVEFERGSQIFRALVAKSKYKELANFGRHTCGHVLLQDHGDTVCFRNIQIRILN